MTPTAAEAGGVDAVVDAEEGLDPEFSWIADNVTVPRVRLITEEAEEHKADVVTSEKASRWDRPV